MTSDTKKITVASIVGGVATGGLFLYMQWSKGGVGNFVQDHPVPALLLGLAIVAAVAYGIARGVMHKRQMRGRVRGPRRVE